MSTITTTPNKALRITGIVITVVISLMFLMSAFFKFFPNEQALEQVKAMGIAVDTFKILGVIELVTIALLIYPRTGVLGSLLLMCYLGGVMATHLVVHQPLAIPILLEVLVWISAAIRFPELTARLRKAI
jgi:hypothetical protein